VLQPNLIVILYLSFDLIFLSYVQVPDPASGSAAADPHSGVEPAKILRE
jgi:hypothetical protein